MSDKIYLRAAQKLGQDAIVLKACEECGELIQALAKVNQGKWSVKHLTQEIADVEIILAQLKISFNILNEVPRAKEAKLRRIEKKLKK